MALLTKKEFAELAATHTKDLSNYIKRGNVVMNPDGSIDDQADRNRAFLQKRLANRGLIPKPEPRVIPKKGARGVTKSDSVDDTDSDDELLDDDGVPSYEKSEKKLKYLDTLKREREVELLKIKEDKIRGTVIPSVLMKPLFLQHNQSIITAFKNAADEIIRLMAKRKGFNANETAEVKGEMVQCINTAMHKATIASTQSVANIIAEHSEKRGVGERN